MNSITFGREGKRVISHCVFHGLASSNNILHWEAPSLIFGMDVKDTYFETNFNLENVETLPDITNAYAANMKTIS